MNPRVINVNCLEDYKLEITFSDNSNKIFDMKPYLDFGIFNELKDKNYFAQVECVGGTIAWPNGQDLCPDTVFLESKEKPK